MIGDNVSDHIDNSSPAWVKSLVSSLDRRRDASAVLPLPVIVGEIAEWVQMASGVDAWQPGANRESLRFDLGQAAAAIGSNLRSQIAAPLAAFEVAFGHLESAPRSTLGASPGTRIDAVWLDVVSTATVLLEALESDRATGASWSDLIAAAQNRLLSRREYRPLAEVLFEQVLRRGHDANEVFRELVSVVSFGYGVNVAQGDEVKPSLWQRLEKAKMIVETPAEEQLTSVWLGYKGRLHEPLEAGKLSFFDAHWAVPNAEPGKADFTHKKELWEIVEHGFGFRVERPDGEAPDVDMIVRVDLGYSVAAGVLDRARAVVETVLSVAIHRAGGIRPQFAEYHVIRSGALSFHGFHAVHAESGFREDSYGSLLLTDAVGRHAPRIADALSRNELPRFLAAAIESRTAADHPFSREMALRTPSRADVSSVIPLSDRVVQHVAAYAGMQPSALFDLLGERWAHSRWLSDLQRAATMCLSGPEGPPLQHELKVEWYSTSRKQPWILFLADRRIDFLSLCGLEHERAWIEKMFASIIDHVIYADLIADYTAEGLVLGARRRRVRNALVHGNPAAFPVVESVRNYSEFISGHALYLALDSFADAIDPTIALAERTDEYAAMQAGQDAASYWRGRLAARLSDLPE